MSNRGRHRKKNKIIRINLQELINLYRSGNMSMLDFQAKIENLPFKQYEPRKT